MDNLEKVVKRLPPHLQASWADESGKLICNGIEPEFSYLTNFVEKKAAIANTAFGKLVGAKPADASKPKVRTIANPAKVSTFAIRNDNEKPINWKSSIMQTGR